MLVKTGLKPIDPLGTPLDLAPFNTKQMTRKTLSILFGLSLPLLFIACEGETGGGDEFTVDPDQGDTLVEDNARTEKTEKIFYAIPSPMETAGLLKKAGAEYNMNLLNPVKNVDNYTSSAKMALNLGVYGSDLSYTSVFEQTQESMFYTGCAQKLADKLDISGAFDEATMERMEANMEHRDSLLSIISETYWVVDAYLKENDRENTSALIIVGGWMEGLYVASQVALADPTDELKQRIAEQKLSLGDLVDLVSTYENDEHLDMVLADLQKLEAAYAEVENSSADASVSDEGGVAVIGGPGPSATLSDEQLANIAETVKAIRDSYIN